MEKPNYNSIYIVTNYLVENVAKQSYTKEHGSIGLGPNYDQRPTIKHIICVCECLIPYKLYKQIMTSIIIKYIKTLQLSLLL